MRLSHTLMVDPDCGEFHQRQIRAEPSAVWDALSRISLADLTITRPLMLVRHLGRKGQPAAAAPLLTHGPVELLTSTPGSYAIGAAIMRPLQLHPERHPVSTVAAFSAFHDPGWVKVLTDFSIQAADGGSLLSTDTRCQATDPATRKRFGAYWRLIRPGSDLVRRDMLRSVDRLATGG